MKQIQHFQHLLRQDLKSEDESSPCCALDYSIAELLETTTKESYETLVATLQKEAINFFETPLIAGDLSATENLTDAQYFL